MTKDASVVAGEFTPEDVAGYEVDVSISSKTIIVTYTVTDYEALITAYFDTDKQRNLANAGKIGYMQNTGANFASLSELVASFANPSHVYTADDYNNLIIYYEACAANPILPEVGKYYLIKNKVNGKYMHVTASGKRGTVLADLTAEEAAKDVSAHFYLTENASKYYMTTQGEYLNWVYYNYDGYEGYTSINLDKYARFFVPTPGYIAFSIAYDNGSQQAYIDAGWYSIKSDISTTVSGSPSGGASNDLAQWTFEEVTSVTIAMNTVEDKSYATFSAPFDVTIGEGAKVYTVKLNGNYAVCSEIADKKIPKGEGVLLISDEGVSSVVATINSGEDFTNLNNNDLIGYYFATTFNYPNTTSNWNLVLGNSATKGIGFYKMNGTVTANKAYLPYPHVEGSSVKGFVLMFDDDDATGIGGLTPNPSCDGGVVYNLSGQRLSRMQKGINIVNGKKVLIK